MVNLCQFMAARCSITIFHHVLVLLLSYNCDWGILPFDKLLSMVSYDFAIADKIGKNGWPIFWPLILEFDSFLALFRTRFAPLARSSSGNPVGLCLRTIGLLTVRRLFLLLLFIS